MGGLPFCVGGGKKAGIGGEESRSGLTTAENAVVVEESRQALIIREHFREGLETNHILLYR